ncbi:MAG: hypothetical protein KI785_02880 [Devosiaceae bacterium]|nr:hypothetical protein [Devosiaceae bacterium MH13]
MGLDQHTSRLFAGLWLDASAACVPELRDAGKIGAALYEAANRHPEANGPMARGAHATIQKAERKANKAQKAAISRRSGWVH